MRSVFLYHKATAGGYKAYQMDHGGRLVALQHTFANYTPPLGDTVAFSILKMKGNQLLTDPTVLTLVENNVLSALLLSTSVFTGNSGGGALSISNSIWGIDIPIADGTVLYLGIDGLDLADVGAFVSGVTLFFDR